MTDAASRRARRDTRPDVKPGPRKRAPERRPLWQTALIGLAVVLVAFFVAVVVTGDGPDQQTETAPVAVEGEALTAVPDNGADDPSVGQHAPQVTGQDFVGDHVELLEDGTATIVVFMAHWCPHCQREIPVIVDHLGDSLPDDVRLVGVTTSTDPGQGNYPPSAWLDHEGWPFDVLVDSDDDEAAAAFGVGSFPTFVVVDADGDVVVRGTGELPTDGLDALVEAARG